MSIKLHSKIYGELPLTNQYISPSFELYCPGAEVIFAQTPSKESFYLIQQFKLSLFTVRYYCLYSTEADTLTVESEKPAITFRLGHNRSHQMITEKLGTQIFHECDYNMFFDPSPSAEYFMQANERFSFVDLLIEPHYSYTLQRTFRKMKKFLDKTEAGEAARFTPYNQVASLDVLRWQRDLEAWSHDENREKKNGLFIGNNLVEIALRKAKAIMEKSGPDVTIEDAKRIYQASKIILNSTKTPTVEMLAKKIGLSTQILERNFKEIYGHSIEKHILENKMSLAIRLIEVRGATLKRIASILGYEDPLLFENDFMKKFGFEPFIKVR